MEPQDCYYNRKPAKKRNCLGIIATILLTAFVFVIGLLIGAVTSLLILISLPAVIVLAVILGLLLLLTIILMLCKKDKKCQCERE